MTNEAISLPSKQLKSIDFYGKEIHTFLYAGKPWVGLRTIVEGMGLSWPTQYRKVISDPTYQAKMVKMHSYFDKGGEQDTVCIPADTLPAFLMSINVKRVKDALKDDVQRFKDESVRVLSEYWYDGSVENPRKNTLAWRQARSEGKIVRVDETDVLKQFVQYAFSQGSTNAGHYYRNVTRMTYAALNLIEQFNAPCTNIREFISKAEIDAVKQAEALTKYFITKGMADGLPYKEIYQLAKEKVLKLSDFYQEIGYHYKDATPETQKVAVNGQASARVTPIQRSLL